MHQLEQLLDLYGVSSSYWNYKGDYVDVPHENRVGLLKALLTTSDADVDTGWSNLSSLTELLEHHQKSLWSKTVEPLTVAGCDNVELELNIPLSDITTQLAITIQADDATIVYQEDVLPNALHQVDECIISEHKYSRRCLSLGSMPLGYYTITISKHEHSVVTNAKLAVCPKTCFTPTWLANLEKQTGIIIQLYSLKSDANFGIGDFSDLHFLIKKLSDLGITSVGLNPLHALLPNVEDNYSPYSPSDRRFINFLYIALPQCDEYYPALQQLDENSKVKLDSQLDDLRSNPYIDYAKVKQIKLSLIKMMFECFKQSADEQQKKSFEAFKRSNIDELTKYVLLDVLTDATSLESAAQTLRQALGDTQLLETICNRYEHECDVYMYAQWLAVTQFESAQQYASEHGMTVGLVNDLAVGADKFGTEVIANGALFCHEAAIGAPPDEIAPVGQNWGLPPINPHMQHLSGYKHIIDLFRANMAHCGALRIDHVMGLTRLWFCPPQQHADHGAYVYYHFEKILNLLKLESHLNQCIIIGEDLGIVPENFRETLRAANILSNKVMYFEREGQGVFKHPSNYEPFALAMLNNHDVPTLTSWWNGHDIDLRDQLNAIEVGKTAQQLHQIRKTERANLMSHLIYGDCLPQSWHGHSSDESANQDLIFAIIKWVAQAQSVLFVLQLEDLTLMTQPVNVPGTFKEYPNWKRKLTHTLEEIFEDDAVTSLLKEVSTIRRSS